MTREREQVTIDVADPCDDGTGTCHETCWSDGTCGPSKHGHPVISALGQCYCDDY